MGVGSFRVFHGRFVCCVERLGDFEGLYLGFWVLVGGGEVDGTPEGRRDRLMVLRPWGFKELVDDVVRGL